MCIQAWALEGGCRGSLTPLDFENFSKKCCFLSFEWKKTNFTTFGSHVEDFWKNPSVPAWKKSFRRPCIQVAILHRSEEYESISKFLIGSQFHVRLRIVSSAISF